MTTYSAKLVHKADGTAKLVIETVFVSSVRADAFLDDVLALINKHERNGHEAQPPSGFSEKESTP